MATIYLDTETKSSVDLKQCGLFRYAEEGRIICLAMAINREAVQVFDTYHGLSAIPARYMHELQNGTGEIWAANAQFDRTMLTAMGIHTDVNRWRCSSVLGYFNSLPGSLEAQGRLCKLDEDKAKDKAGRKLMQLFSFPDSEGTPENMPEEWAQYMEYCRRDVVAMRSVIKLMPKFNPNLWHEYSLDQTINDRGVMLDMDLINRMVKLVDQTQKHLGKAVRDNTFGRVEDAQKRQQILDVLNGIFLKDDPIVDLKSATIDAYLATHPDLETVAKELLIARSIGGAASVKKWAVLQRMANTDGRLRGPLSFYGAARTGRWAGKGAQLQNLPRPVLKQAAIDVGIEHVKADIADLVYDNASMVELAQSALRSAIIAPPDKKLLVADLANIEGRVLTWVAGESWKIKAFEEYDAGTGPDLYKMAYAKAFRKSPEEVTDDERQLGKVLELACGYMGGVGGFVTFAAAYRVDLSEMAAGLAGTIPADVEEECLKGWEWAVKQHRTLGLEGEVYRACDALKRMWRRAHPRTVKLWDNIKRTAIQAESNPKETFYLNDLLAFRHTGKYLLIQLPSGRIMVYPGFQVTFDAFKPEQDDEEAEVYNLMFKFVQAKGPNMVKTRTYSGKMCENLVQAIARDVLMQGLINAENDHLNPVLSVHDEIICEVPDTLAFTPERLVMAMTTLEPWMEGLPLAAKGGQVYRYCK